MGPLSADRTALLHRPDDLPDDFLALAKVELAPGERLLWAGRPRPDPVDRAEWVTQAVWSVGIGSVAILSILLLAESERRGKPERIAMIVPVVGVASAVTYMMILITTVNERRTERKKRSRTSYALSDRRAICWLPAGRPRGVKVVTIPSRSIGSVHRVEREDGSGSVLFAGNVPDPEFAGFVGVPEVRLVEGLARDVLVNPDFRGLSDPAESEADD